jgi:peptidoglycan/xylan/chitin deacetylase (PgdA/CDA1 family)
MNSKKWLISFVTTILAVLAAVAGFNAFTDPFGVFGDKYFNWYSNNMTQNPRVAKVAYLDKNYEKYDSFILGASATSGLSPEIMEKYTGNRYYNLFVYGADMHDTSQMASYILSNYRVKNIVLNLGVTSAATYKGQKKDLTQYMHTNVTGSSKINFYSRYLMANPNYGIAKIRDKRANTYLQQPFDVFNEENGTYDKSVRDVEHFGDLDGYYEKYPVFYGFKGAPKGLGYVDECIESVSNIKKMCDEMGVSLTVIFSPMYGADAISYSPDVIKKLMTGMAEVTDFWDFTLSSISEDPRYFYDTTHFRNNVGDMMLAKIHGDDSIYIPDDIGTFVTRKNAGARAKELEDWILHFKGIYGDDKDNYYPEAPAPSTKVPILMYHHLADDGKNGSTMSAEGFEGHIKALSLAGYTGVSPEELISYAEKGKDLPEKPILITFDDGYMSNYEIAFPILKKYNMKATIFVIGVSLGKDKYKDTEKQIIPHFGQREIEEMVESGLISIQSHTFDMHQSEEMDGPGYRYGVVQKDGERESSYIELFAGDIEKSKVQIKEAGGREVIALAYPNGIYDTLSEVLLSQWGIKLTLLTDEGTNTVVKGLPQTLRGLKRFKGSDELSPEALLTILGNH